MSLVRLSKTSLNHITLSIHLYTFAPDTDVTLLTIRSACAHSLSAPSFNFIFKFDGIAHRQHFTYPVIHWIPTKSWLLMMSSRLTNVYVGTDVVYADHYYASCDMYLVVRPFHPIEGIMDGIERELHILYVYQRCYSSIIQILGDTIGSFNLFWMCIWLRCYCNNRIISNNVGWWSSSRHDMQWRIVCLRYLTR